jgi:hypothetical protein
VRIAIKPFRVNAILTRTNFTSAMSGGFFDPQQRFSDGSPHFTLLPGIPTGSTICAFGSSAPRRAVEDQSADRDYRRVRRFGPSPAV